MKKLISTILMSIGLLASGGAFAEYTTDFENELVTICKVIKEGNQSLLRVEVHEIHRRYMLGKIQYKEVIDSLTCKSFSALEYAIHMDEIESAQILAEIINVDLNEYIALLNIEAATGVEETFIEQGN